MRDVVGRSVIMRVIQAHNVLVLTLLVILSVAMNASGQTATLGRGLEQLVQLHESGSTKLTRVLEKHSLNRSGELLVQVHLLPSANKDAVLTELSQRGFHLQAISELDPSVLEGYISLPSVRATATVRGVKSVHAARRPITFAGSVQSQAVAVEKADLAQARGFNGNGTRIGILSDSYNACPTCLTTAPQDIETGDLPNDVAIVEELPDYLDPGTDEGRALLQLAHDVAPSSKLGFATGVVSEVGFSNNILKLRRQFHADVIVDDILYLDEPMFSDGLLALTVDEVVKEGAAYYSAAFNNGIEAYEDDYRPISFEQAKDLVRAGKANLNLDDLVAHGHTPVSVQSFIGPDGRISMTQEFVSFADNGIVFQWDEPFFMNKVKTDFDIFVFDQNGHYLDPGDPNFPGFYTTDDNTQTDEALQLLDLPNTYPQPVVGPGGLTSSTYQLLIAKMNDGPARHIKYVVINGLGESERQNAPSIFGHAAARHGQAVAAMYYPITNFPEDFSSPGPVTILFDRNGNRLSEPEIRDVPQVTAIDGVDNTFFGWDTDGNGLPNFFGTSAAAPDAGAVAALVIQASGGPGTLSPDEIYRRLQNTATAIPLSERRTRSWAHAGPLDMTANGDYTRYGEYFQVRLDPFTRDSVNSISIDLTRTPTGMLFFPDPTRFHVGISEGINADDISATYSPDNRTVLLKFKPDVFRAGGFFTFGLSIYAPIQQSTQEDADRMEGARVTVTMKGNAVQSGSFEIAPKLPVNRFTGAGLINADRATRGGSREQE
jgi:hypothetical protein